MNICQVKCESSQPKAFAVTTAITFHTTPQEFEALLKEYPDFRIHYGGRCGWNVFCACAQRGNSNLLKYLLDTYGPMFVNIGNEFGCTPIFCATTCDDEHAAIFCIDILLNFGADPTIATSMTHGGRAHVERGTTPLEHCKILKKELIFKHLQRVLGKKFQDNDDEDEKRGAICKFKNQDDDDNDK